jgi:PAS domain S-box-containing protein
MFNENPEQFLEHSSVGIHSVSAEGVILYANSCELEMLGYEKNEYVGHHVSEFQVDSNCLDDMLTRLNNLDILKNYPAKVKGKNEIKYVLYNSNVFQKNGQFIHTRCYANEIEKIIYDIFVENTSGG